MKLDLDDIERKAKAATQGEWAADRVPGLPRDDEPILANVIGLDLDSNGRQQQIADCYDNTSCPDSQCEANAEHIAATSPPVVLALIGRIRELESGQAQIARVFSGDVATARVVTAATAFVDEQGKRVSIERGYTIGRAEDFAGELFAELVRAVEAAGR